MARSDKNSNSGLSQGQMCFHELFDDAKMAVLALNTDLKVVYSNSKFNKSLGYTPDQIEEVNASELFEESIIPVIQKKISEQPIEKEFPIPTDISARDHGTERFSIDLNLIQISNEKFILVFFRRTHKRHRQRRIIRELNKNVLDLSAQLINCEIDEIDNKIDSALRDICSLLHYNRATIFKFEKDEYLKVLNEYSDQKICPYSEVSSELKITPWFFHQLKMSNYLLVEDVNSLPLEAYMEKDNWLQNSIRAILVIPIFYKGNFVGFIQFDSMEASYAPEHRITLILRQLSSIIANALDRKKLNQELKKRAQLEHILVSAADLVGVSPEQTQNRINKCLQLISTFLNTSSTTLYLLDNDSFSPAYSHDSNISDKLENRSFSLSKFKPLIDDLREKKYISICDIAQIQPEYTAKLHELAGKEVKSFYAFPLKANTNLIGFLTFTFKNHTPLKRTELESLKIPTKIFACSLQSMKIRDQLAYRQIETENIFGHMPDALAIFDIQRNQQGKPVNYVFRKINNSFEKLTGLSFDEIKGKSVLDFFPEDSKVVFEKLSRSANEKINQYFQRYSEYMKKYFNATTFYLSEHQVALIFYDITERKQIESLLEYRIGLEDLITEISNSFIDIDYKKIDKNIRDSLQKIARFANADRGYVFLFSDDRTTMSNTYEWTAENVKPFMQQLQEIPTERFSWFVNKIRANNSLFIDDIPNLPKEAQTEKEEWLKENINTLIVVPMRLKDEIIGFLGFDYVTEKEKTHSIVADILKIVGELYANALSQKEFAQLQQYRDELEKTISDISTSFINIEYGDIDRNITSSLEKIATFANADIAAVFMFSEDFKFIEKTHSWSLPETPNAFELNEKIPTSNFPWVLSQVKKDKAIFLQDISHLPEQAVRDKEFYRHHKVKSFIIVPITQNGNTIGFLGFHYFSEILKAPALVADVLRLLGELYANALKRKEMSRALRYSELLEKTISNISTEFINLKAQDIDEGLNRALNVISRFCRADRGFIYLINKDHISCEYEWARKKEYARIERSKEIEINKFDAVFAEFKDQGFIKLSSHDELCNFIDISDQRFADNLKTIFLLPINLHGQIIGLAGYTFILNEPEREQETLTLLQIVSEIFANALDRKKTSLALEKSERLYKTLVENFAMGISLVKDDYEIVMANSALAKFYHKPLDRIIGKKCYDLFVDQKDICLECPGQEAMDTNKTAEHEEKIILPDGRTQYLMIKAFPMTDETGKPTGFIEVVEDITEEKQLKQQFRQAKYSMDNSIDGIIWIKSDGSITYANHAACQKYGYSYDELTNMKVFDFDPNYNPQNWDKHWQEIKKQKSGYFETTSFTKSGEKLYLEIAANHIEFEGQEYHCSFIRDIKERKEYQEKILNSEKRLKSILDTIPSGVFWKDKDLRYSGLNKQFLKMIGYKDQSQIIGKTDDQLFSEYESFQADDRKIIKSGKPLLNIQESVTAEDHKTIWVRTKKVPLRDSENNIIGVLGSIEDITEQRELKEQLRLAKFSTDNSFDGIIWIKEDGSITYANKSFCKKSGYSYSELLESKIYEIDKSYTQETWHQFWQVLKKEKTIFHEKKATPKSGKVIPVEVISNYLVFEGQEYDCAVVRDITERKEDREEILRSRQMLRLVIDTIPVRVFWKDQDSNYLGCNQLFAEDMGFDSPDQIPGKTDYDMFYSDKEADFYRKDDLNVMSNDTPKFDYEGELTTPKGTIVKRSSKLPLHDPNGNVMGILGVYQDITQQKKDKEEIIRSQKMMRLILDTSPVAVFWKDKDSRFLGCNKTFLKITGYDNPEQVIGKKDKELWKKYSEIYVGYDHEVIETGKSLLGYEQPLITHDNKEKWLRANKVPLRDLEGNIIGVLGSFEDITQQKNLQKKLYLTQYSIDHSLDLIIWFDNKGKVTTANDTALLELGYTYYEIKRMHIKKLISTFDDKKWNKFWNRLLKERQALFEDEISLKSGQKKPVEIAASYLSYQGEQYVFALVRDISERKESEELILKSRQMLRLVLDTIPVRVFWKNKSSKYIGCNTLFANDAGFSGPNEIVGKTDYDMAWETEAEFYRADDANVIRTGQPKLDYREPQTTPDGEKIILNTSKVPLRDIDGKIIGVLGTYEDITEKVRTERELKLTQFAVENSIDEVFWVTKDGSFDYVNEAACRTLDYSKNELLKKKIYEIDNQIQDQMWEKHWKDLKRRGYILTETQQKTKEGKLISVELASNYLSYGNEEYECVFARDITERKKIEFSLRMREQCFRAIADFTYGWETWVSPTGRPLWTNSSVERITGYTVDECMRMTDYPASLIYEEDRQKTANAFQKAIKGEKGEHFQTRLRRKDGKIIWIEINWQPIYDAKGVSQGHRASVYEITHFKEIEIAYKKLKKELDKK